MQNVYVVAYRWLDIEGSQTSYEFYHTELEARMAADKLADDQQRLAHVDPNSVGKLSITIDEYGFLNHTMERTV